MTPEETDPDPRFLFMLMCITAIVLWYGFRNLNMLALAVRRAPVTEEAR